MSNTEWTTALDAFIKRTGLPRDAASIAFSKTIEAKALYAKMSAPSSVTKSYAARHAEQRLRELAKAEAKASGENEHIALATILATSPEAAKLYAESQGA